MKALRVTVWFFFTASSLLLGLGALFGLASEPSHRGPGAPLEGVASAIAVVVCFVCAIAFLYCLWAHPPADAFTGRNWVIAIVSYTAIVGIVVALTHVGRYTLTIRVIDQQGGVVPNVSVQYACYPKGEGIGRLDRPATGVISTDSSGIVKIRTNHAHTVSVLMRKAQFKTAGFHLEAAGYRYPHQIVAPEVTVRVPTGLFRGPGGWLFPPQGDVTIEVTFPGA